MARMYCGTGEVSGLFHIYSLPVIHEGRTEERRPALPAPGQRRGSRRIAISPMTRRMEELPIFFGMFRPAAFRRKLFSGMEKHLHPKLHPNRMFIFFPSGEHPL